MPLTAHHETVQVRNFRLRVFKDLLKIPSSLGWEDPLEEGMEPTSVFLPGEPHGQRNLAGYSPWGHKESDMSEHKAHITYIMDQKSESYL